MNFAKFPSIESFHQVIALMKAYPHLKNNVKYRSKIKLHGTNAAIRINAGEVKTQSRIKFVELDDNHFGFVPWVHSILDYWKSINVGEITIFGEWCGPGIAKKCAIQKIPNKIFAVFAVMLGEIPEIEENQFLYNEMIFEPEEIEKILGPNKPAEVHVLPWFDEFDANYLEFEGLESIAEFLNKKIEEIEKCDPWVKSVFGVEGVAEGIVCYPVEIGGNKNINRKQFSDLVFKAKGAAHKVNKTKEAVQIDPEVAKSIEEFVGNFVTEPRLEQAVMEIGGIDLKKTGEFLKWILKDIEKESKLELEVADLSWKEVCFGLQKKAKDWYMAKCKEI
ncbi:MAG: hypothetical protein EKK64_00705 [Neisseriaceae bacterium]|nr:MAG: hypothetical protein EKK64_00705 [Neisseriaceae bacterium]